MSPDRNVLNHLLEGREALVAEVERLSAAIRDLDAVIDRVRDTGPKTEGRRSGARRSAAAGGEGQKSIRVLVLEMLAAEDRDFGLTEIIERIHGAGIDAHDDAVRSITVKLMKDGRVERVGRGHYRLTRRTDPAPLNLAQTWDAPAT